MSIGFFTDKTFEPTAAEIAAALGAAGARFDEMLAQTRQIPRVAEDFRFMYGKNYGWARRFRLKGKLLVSFYPNEGFFTAQVILSPPQLAAIAGTGFHAGVQQALAAATLYEEGKWLFVPVRTAADGADVRRLMALKLGKG